MKFSVASEDSVLNEHREIAGIKAAPDFATRYPAVAITADFVPVKVTGEFKAGQRPLLFFTPDFSSVVVESAIFPEGLNRVRATCLEPGDSREAGKISPDAREQIGGRQLALFLIRSGVIETWIHLGAELELVSESDLRDSGEYTAAFRGSHRYFTNEEVTEPVSFSVRIDRNGRIVVDHGGESSLNREGG